MNRDREQLVFYRVNTTSVTPIVLYRIFNTSLGDNIQINYKVKDGSRKTKCMALQTRA
jgi:hypothetical protein